MKHKSRILGQYAAMLPTQPDISQFFQVQLFYFNVKQGICSTLKVLNFI
jgi:hypothetical protein